MTVTNALWTVIKYNVPWYYPASVTLIYIKHPFSQYNMSHWLAG